MSATQERRTAPTERDERTRTTRLRRAVQEFVRYDNDNLQAKGSIDALAQSKKRTWEMFVRWLMLGGLLFALLLVAVLAFVYSGYP